MTAWDLLFGRYLCFFRGIFPLSSAIKVFLYCKVGLKTQYTNKARPQVTQFFSLAKNTFHDISEFLKKPLIPRKSAQNPGINSIP